MQQCGAAVTGLGTLRVQALDEAAAEAMRQSLKAEEAAENGARARRAPR